MGFIGRQAEMEELKSWIRSSGGSRLTVIHGRRRVGKTKLVEKAHEKESFFQFEGLEGQPQKAQQRHFLNRLAELTGRNEYRLIQTGNWVDILKLLADFIGKKKTVVFFDEFQWMASERSQLVSALKYVWDNEFLKKNNVHLILCGSISSFMVKKVIRSKALYGRVDREMHLLSLSIGEVLGWLCPKRSLVEVLEFYFCLGGVPYYLRMIDPSESLTVNLKKLCFKKNGALFHEFEKIFASHFGRNPAYKKILTALSGTNFMSREQIQKCCHLDSGGTLSDYLEELEMAGFVEKYTPLHKTSAPRLIRHKISDPFLNFYFRFVEPLKKTIESAKGELPLSQLLPDRRYEGWKGLAFEYFCYQQRERIAHALGFGGIAYQAGSFFTRSHLKTTAQIDLMFIRADRVMTVCELKYRDDPVGKEVIDEVEKKVRTIPNPRGMTIEKVLIVRTEPAEALVREGYFHRILTLRDLFNYR